MHSISILYTYTIILMWLLSLNCIFFHKLIIFFILLIILIVKKVGRVKLIILRMYLIS